MRATASQFTLASVFCVWLTVFCVANEDTAEIDPESGLHKDAEETWQLVEAHCGTMCHSGRLVTQQRLDRANWLKSIRRMQAKEGLWNLLDAEPKILDYLTAFYGPSEKPKNQRVRRAQLKRTDTPTSSNSNSLLDENKSTKIKADSPESSESQNTESDGDIED